MRSRTSPPLERVLLLGAEIGVKGRDMNPDVPGRVRELVAARSGDRPLVAFDGGIRRHTAPLIAEAGADGVVPGTLVFGDGAPLEAVAAISALTTRSCATEAPSFWRDA